MIQKFKQFDSSSEFEQWQEKMIEDEITVEVISRDVIACFSANPRSSMGVERWII